MKIIAYTIIDIAKLAGVSKSTVSRYISGDRDKVSQKTQRKISKVIAELDYHPNQVAVGLAKKQFTQIGVVISDTSNPFSAIVMKGIFDACAKHNYMVSFANSNGDPERERQNIQNFLAFNIDRLIINTCGGNEDYLDSLDPAKTVIVDRPLEQNRFYTVTSDNRESSYTAVNYLLGDSTTPVAFLTPTLGNVITRQIRYQGYLDAISDRQEPLLVSYKDQRDADTQLRRLFKTHQRLSIFTVNGEALKMLLRFVKTQHYQIGVDVAVVSFEDWDWMEFITPPITAVQQDSYGMGYLAAEHLLADNPDASTEVVKLHAEMVIRDSAFH